MITPEVVTGIPIRGHTLTHTHTHTHSHTHTHTHTHSHTYTHTALQLVPEDWLSQYYLGQVCGVLNQRPAATSHFKQGALMEFGGENQM